MCGLENVTKQNRGNSVYNRAAMIHLYIWCTIYGAPNMASTRIVFVIRQQNIQIFTNTIIQDEKSCLKNKL
jgi:hypothetical protein